MNTKTRANLTRHLERLRHKKAAQIPQPETPPAMTGAEAIGFWEREGVFGLWSDGPDSPELARQLRQEAERRETDG